MKAVASFLASSKANYRGIDTISNYLRNHKDDRDRMRSGNEREQLYQFRKMMYDADLEVGLVPCRER